MELSFVILTPYMIRKSRTGAILARLLGQTSCELVYSQMFAPTKEQADAFIQCVADSDDPEEQEYRELLRDYIRESFYPSSNGRRHRILMLVFQGENAASEIARIAGSIRISDSTGETIRDAFGDLIRNRDGSIRHFEPAVFIPEKGLPIQEQLSSWIEFSRTEPPVLRKICEYERPEAVEETLVLIKPDSWYHPSARPGAIVDMFSRTGLRIISARVVQFSVSQALDFYKPVREILKQKLAPNAAEKAKEVLEKEFGCTLPASAVSRLQEDVGIPYAEKEFENIVEFMSGRRPSKCPEEEKDEPGTVKCLALIYEGEEAVSKIRNVLGPTDPTKAPWGTVRAEFGSDVMVNTAHASDSRENAAREISILNMDKKTFEPVVSKILEACHGTE